MIQIDTPLWLESIRNSSANSLIKTLNSEWGKTKKHYILNALKEYKKHLKSIESYKIMMNRNDITIDTYNYSKQELEKFEIVYGKL